MIAVREPAQAPPDAVVMLSGYLFLVIAAALYLRAVNAGVQKDVDNRDLREQVAAKDRTIGERDEQLAAVEAERDVAVTNWTGWYRRAIRAETANEQGPAPVRGRRCLAATTRGAT